MIFEILGLFFNPLTAVNKYSLVNPLTADDKYSLVNRGNLLQHFQMQLSQKPKIFSEFFFAFSKFRFNFEHFQKILTLSAHVRFNLQTPKNVVR